jgi:hypothetical protein
MLLPLDLKVHLASAPVDMRKSYQTLGVLVKNVLNKDPFCGHLFVFYKCDTRSLNELFLQKKPERNLLFRQQFPTRTCDRGNAVV